MTKKRFIKLAMSMGKERNCAQKLAARYLANKTPYTAAWRWFLVISAMEKLSAASTEIGLSFSSAQSAVNHFASLFKNRSFTVQSKCDMM